MIFYFTGLKVVDTSLCTGHGLLFPVRLNLSAKKPLETCTAVPVLMEIARNNFHMKKRWIQGKHF